MPPVTGRLRVGVLVSGSGTNLQALIDLCAMPGFPAEIVVVISNKPDVLALERAARGGIACRVIAHRAYPDRPSFDGALDQALREHEVELVCLAGFMRVLTTAFVELWRDRLINIHPSLLPAFRGLHTHAQALTAGVRFSGCTVHFVRPELDDGPIIVQAVVPVLPGDDEVGLAARVQAAEHRAYPLALRLIAERRIRLIDDRVEVLDPVAEVPALLNPPDLPTHPPPGR
ncbi:MAG TPA: phosphoribosylglycinamide formyltransferase [Stellaceae bacterium]|nr:phosphoribosylglycinamide formyltransferase [Stellaceae bacterium]